MWRQFMTAYSILAINVIFSYFAISLLLLDEIYSELCWNVYLIFVNVHLTNEFSTVYMLMTSHKASLGYGTEGKFYWNKWNTWSRLWLRQLSSVIKLRTDQSTMCKAKHPSVLPVLRMTKKTLIAKNLDTKLSYQLCSWDSPKKLFLPCKILDICISYLWEDKPAFFLWFPWHYSTNNFIKRSCRDKSSSTEWFFVPLWLSPVLSVSAAFFLYSSISNNSAFIFQYVNIYLKTLKHSVIC